MTTNEGIRNLRVVNCEYNKGLASVRNIGLRVAKGRYIGFVDGDDWVDIRMCEVLYQRASEDNADVLIADANVFYEDSKTFGHSSTNISGRHWTLG